MHWGHSLPSKDGAVEVTREELNDHMQVEFDPEPPIPEVGADAWRWWWDLNNRRNPGFEGVAPITFSDVTAWLALTGIMASREEIRWIFMMDDAFISKVSEERKAKREADESKSKSK